MNDKKIAEQVQKTIERIRANEHTPDALIRIYKNVAKSKDLTDDQRQNLVDEIEAHLWKFAPPKAKKVFGPLNRGTRQTLETYLQTLLTKYDLTNNRHKNKVKTGGVVLTGEGRIYDYISYRHPTSEQYVHLAFHQFTADEPIQVRVSKGKVGQPDFVKTLFPENHFEDATDLFEQDLRRVLEGLPA